MKFNLINHFDSKELIFNAIISNICELINLLRRGDYAPSTFCDLIVTPLSNAFGTKLKQKIFFLTLKGLFTNLNFFNF